MSGKGELAEVELVFYVKIFGRAPANEIENRSEDIRQKMLAFEVEFNNSNLLRMHVTETRCV